MNRALKLAAIGALALGATSTAALAVSELPRGATTGLSIGMPLPEGVYDISIGSYASAGTSNEAYAIPAWLIWWTPWQIAGGRVVLDTATGVASSWNSGAAGTDSLLNTLVEAGIGWNLGGGWGVSAHAGAWLPSSQRLPTLLGRDYTAFQGAGAISYTANGWNLTATGVYGSGGDEKTVAGYPTFLKAQQAEWFNLDLTAAKHFGKYETGVVAYGSWDLSNSGSLGCYAATGIAAACKQHQFAVGGLVGYNFGAFLAQFKLTTDVDQANYRDKDTRGTVTLVTRLWSPEKDGPLK
jgi:hypothetical protein